MIILDYISIWYWYPMGRRGRHWDPGNLRSSLQLMVDESSSFSFITVATSTFGMSPGINLARWEGRLGCFWKKHLATGGILWNYEWKRHETSPFFWVSAFCSHIQMIPDVAREVLSSKKGQATHHWCMIVYACSSLYLRWSVLLTLCLHHTPTR